MTETPEKDPITLFIQEHGQGNYSPEVQRQFELLLARTGRVGTGEAVADNIIQGAKGPRLG